MAKGIVVRSDRTFEDIDFADIEHLQDAVGGYIQVVKLQFRAKHWPYVIGGTMFLDEDGRLKNLPINIVASGVSLAGGSISQVVGTAVFAGIANRHGEYTNISEEIGELIEKLSTEYEEIDHDLSS